MDLGDDFQAPPEPDSGPSSADGTKAHGSTALRTIASGTATSGTATSGTTTSGTTVPSTTTPDIGAQGHTAPDATTLGNTTQSARSLVHERPGSSGSDAPLTKWSRYEPGGDVGSLRELERRENDILRRESEMRQQMEDFDRFKQQQLTELAELKRQQQQQHELDRKQIESDRDATQRRKNEVENLHYWAKKGQENERANRIAENLAHRRQAIMSAIGETKRRLEDAKIKYYADQGRNHERRVDAQDAFETLRQQLTDGQSRIESVRQQIHDSLQQIDYLWHQLDQQKQQLWKEHDEYDQLDQENQSQAEQYLQELKRLQEEIKRLEQELARLFSG